MKSLTMTLLVAFFTCTMLLADEMPLITASGEGEAMVAPDMARISLGVTARSEAAADALDQTSQAVARVMARLDAEGIEGSDVQTGRLSLEPIRTPQPEQSSDLPLLSGFEASNELNVIVRDLAKLGRLLDLAVEDGANQLRSLTFLRQDPEPALSLARAAAVRDAIAKAQELADAAGVSVGQIQSITEQSGGVAPRMEMAASRMADVPVAPGALKLSVRVILTFAIEQ